MRKTKAKKIVEKIFVSTKVPINLNTIFTSAQKELPNLAYSTVYRIVQKLELDNKITKIDWRERGSFYEWKERDHHHHIICQNCDSISDIDDKTLSFDNKTVSQKTGFLVRHHSIELYGLCPPCQKEIAQ